MPVDVKGRIIYNPESDQEYTLDCKQLAISEEASGTIEDDIEELRQKVTTAISEEFHIAPSTINITGYVMSLSFSIEGPTNHTLSDFADKTFTKKDKE